MIIQPNSLLLAQNNLPDTLRIINISPPTSIPGEVYVIIGVVIGAVLSVVSGILIAKFQARIQIKTAFFARRLEVYVKIAEMSWEGYHVLLKSGPREQKGAFPKAYHTFEGLRSWLNSIAEVIDRNRFLLDQETYRAFEGLNKKILEHINQIGTSGLRREGLNLMCRNLGRASVGEIQRLSESFVDAARRYIRSKYGVDVEKVV